MVLVSYSTQGVALYEICDIYMKFLTLNQTFDLYVKIVSAFVSALFPPCVYLIRVFGKMHLAPPLASKPLQEGYNTLGSIQTVPFSFVQEIDGVESKCEGGQLQMGQKAMTTVNQKHSTRCSEHKRSRKMQKKHLWVSHKKLHLLSPLLLFSCSVMSNSL